RVVFESLSEGAECRALGGEPREGEFGLLRSHQESMHMLGQRVQQCSARSGQAATDNEQVRVDGERQISNLRSDLGAEVVNLRDGRLVPGRSPVEQRLGLISGGPAQVATAGGP